ncbi:MAG: hypothetical protein EBQ80_04705 [Proteobacteria bacterium]|nr:hypothetical protein [Pseudomonadota bacterium]
MLLVPLTVGLLTSLVTTSTHCGLLSGLYWLMQHPRMLRQRRHAVLRMMLAMLIATTMLTLAHLLESAMWGAVYFNLHLVNTLPTAFFDALLASTSLGFTFGNTASSWRLLEPMNTLNGILLASMSAAIMLRVLTLASQPRG